MNRKEIRVAGFTTTQDSRMVRDSLQAAATDPSGFWRAAAAAGLLEVGRSDEAPELLAVLGEEIGRLGRDLPWIECLVIAARCLAVDPQTHPLSERLVAGETVVSVSDDWFRPAQKEGLVGHRTSDTWCLNGWLRPTGPALPAPLLVRAFTENGQSGLFLIPAASLPAAASNALLHLQDLPATALAAPDLETVETAVAVAVAAECVGACGALIEKTLDHVRLRRQFGKPLFEFQAVQMRLADMVRSLESARALVRLASATRNPVHAQAALVLALPMSRAVWQASVQLHGAVGTTVEGGLAGFVRRLTRLELLSGNLDRRRMALAEALRTPAASGVLPPRSHAAFRARVRAFLADTLSPGFVAAQAATAGFVVEPSVGVAWTAALAEGGWLAQSWPHEAGGAQAPVEERYLFQLESDRAGAPHVSEMGVRMVGPMLMACGDAAQQPAYLPAILAGTDYWCQGYSEPGAGSDLASLTTRAERDGDAYVVNGSKIWTTHAQHANRMFALVRTSTEGRRQDGITFLLIDMASAGITVRPIATMDGSDDLNEVFFDNVRVPLSQRVGQENEGWAVAKSLLAFERGGGLASPELRARHEQMGCPQDVFLRARWAALGAEVMALEALELSHGQGEALALSEAAAASLFKLGASEMRQKLSELALEVAGTEALAGGPENVLVRRYFADRSHTIFGGAAEIQKTLIARAL